MGLFAKKKAQEPSHHHPAVHQQLVAVSFNHVRKDVQNLYEWIRYLHTQNKAQQELINHLSRQVQSHAMRNSAIDEKSQAHIQELRSRIADMDRKIAALASRPIEAPQVEPTSEVLTKMSQIVERLEQKAAAPAPVAAPSTSISSLQEKVAKKVQQNSKEYIKNMIRGLIQKYSKISGLQLREIVVDEQALCSRSSFYRLLAEVEEEGTVQVLPNGKEKVYSLSSDAVAIQVRNL